MKRMLIGMCIAIAFAAGIVQAEEVVNCTVMEGENVQTIAGKFNLAVEELTVPNGLGEEGFVAGAVIIVPPKHATGFFAYGVPRGLAATEITTAGARQSFLHEVDVISSVSGGFATRSTGSWG